MYLLGFDIGGTKSAVVTAKWDGKNITVIKKQKTPTDKNISPEEMIDKMIGMADSILDGSPDAIGIACGGPLDAERGVILSPPNLPGWDNIEVVKLIREHYGVPVTLQNDANACALAEWRFGAGRGLKNMVFLTFGTGLGAGLILDGKLYDGTHGNAGEVGHVRLANDGPIGFGKRGSFEGFCSGGGIAQLGYSMALEALKKGVCPSYFKDGMSPDEVTAKSVGDAAEDGDETALEVYRTSGRYLGRGLSLIIDILDPQAIVIGGIFTRSRELLWQYAREEIAKEALLASAEGCAELPAKLGESIGDYSAIAIATLNLEV